jgi:membrane dipeptidase
MYICDCHCDTISEVYKQQVSLYENKLQLDLKRIQANGGGLQFCGMFVPTAEYRYKNGIRYTLCLVDKYLSELRQLKQQGVDIFQVLHREDLDQVLNHSLSTLLTIEEGGAIDGSLEVLRMYYELGVRVMTLVWSNRNDIADGVNEECTRGGLTRFGRQVVAEMNRLGMAVDVSHISKYGFWQVLGVSQKPVIATHSNAFALCSHPRNLDDEQIKALNDSDGFIGLTFAPQFLEQDWQKACQESVYRHFAHMLDVMGNDDHLGFGSDFDGIAHTPVGIAGVQDFKPLIEFLTLKLGEKTMQKLTHVNCLNYLKRVL